MQDEFYAIAFRKKIYNSLQEMQQDIDKWIHLYNNERTHSGSTALAKHPCKPL